MKKKKDLTKPVPLNRSEKGYFGGLLLCACTWSYDMHILSNFICPIRLRRLFSSITDSELNLAYIKITMERKSI